MTSANGLVPLRSVMESVPEDGPKLIGIIWGMESDVGQEARLIVVKMVSFGYTRNSISDKNEIKVCQPKSFLKFNDI